MPLNIPMPGLPLSGLNQAIATGGNLFQQMMSPVLEREKMKQLEEHFQSQLGLSKAAAGRAAQASTDAHKLALMKLDPNREINQIKKLYELAMTQQNGGQGFGSPANNAPQNNEMLRDKLQAMGMFGQEQQAPQGQGMMPMQQQEELPQYPIEESMGNNQQGSNSQGISQPNLMQMIVGGALKKKTGYDPFAPKTQTPQEKMADKLELFRQEQALTAQNKTGETATNNILTSNQKSLQAIDLTLPRLKQLIDGEVPGIGSFSPAGREAYESKTGGIIDTLIAAQDLPKIVESVNLVKQQLRRGTGESVASYKSRMRNLYNELLERRKSAKQILKTKKVTSEGDIEPLTEGIKELNGKKYKKINGEWHELS